MGDKFIYVRSGDSKVDGVGIQHVSSKGSKKSG